MVNVFNVKDYGAVGDGIHDDQEAIQTAVDACDAAGGGTVVFPPGRYRSGVATISPTTPGKTAKLYLTFPEQERADG